MSPETASHDLTLNALAGLTGGHTDAAFVGTGLVTGLATDRTAQRDAHDPYVVGQSGQGRFCGFCQGRTRRPHLHRRCDFNRPHGGQNNSFSRCGIQRKQSAK
jgi:hypothetical protein